MRNRFRMKKDRLGKKIGCILGSENNDEDYSYKNIVRAYLGEEMMLIRCNMNQLEFDRFCNGELSREELLKFT